MSEAVARNQAAIARGADSASACHAREGKGAQRLSFYSLAKLFFCLFILLKPLYLLPSGSLQVGDAMIVLSLGCLIIHERTSFRIERIDLLYIGFVCCVIVINGFYFAYYGDSSFLTYTLYYIFNLFTILMFRRFVDDGHFLSTTVGVVRATLVVQVAVLALGLGEWYDANRYMGTFNDPNQLGFYVFSSFLFIKIVGYKLGLKPCYLDDAMAVVLILETASTSNLLGLVVYYAGRILHLIIQKNRYRWIVLAACIFGVFLLYQVYVAYDAGLFETGITVVDYAIQRIVEKMRKLFAEGDTYSTSILMDRGVDKVVNFPQYLLCGAGEGYWDRFGTTSTVNEVHSTVVGLLFYYGIFPFCLFVSWVISNFKIAGEKFDVNTLLLYLPIFVECLFLANQRQPIFWIIFVAAGIPSPITEPQLEGGEILSC